MNVYLSSTMKRSCACDSDVGELSSAARFQKEITDMLSFTGFKKPSYGRISGTTPATWYPSLQTTRITCPGTPAAGLRRCVMALSFQDGDGQKSSSEESIWLKIWNRAVTMLTILLQFCTHPDTFLLLRNPSTAEFRRHRYTSQ